MLKFLVYIGTPLIIVSVIFVIYYFFINNKKIIIPPFNEPVISNLLPQEPPKTVESIDVVITSKLTSFATKEIEVPKTSKPVIREELNIAIVPTTSPSEATPKLENKTKVHQVSIEKNKFIPETITIKIGETVTWNNNDDELHWPASDPHPTHTGVIDFDVGSDLAKGEYYSYTFRRVGDFLYHDHPAAVVNDTATMVGVIKVVSE